MITNDSIVTSPYITLLSYSSVNVGIYHNSIQTVSPHGRILFEVHPLYANSGIDIRNNVFSHIQNAYDTLILGTYKIFYTGPFPAPASVIRLNYNNYFSDTASFIFSGANYTNLNAWRDFCHCDTNSLFHRPGFTGKTDLTPNANDSATWSLNGRATHLTLVPKDINDSIRPPSRAAGVPDIGAYEVTPNVQPPYAVASPVMPFPGSMQAFLFGYDTVAKIEWAPSAPVPAAVFVQLFSGDTAPNVGSSTNNYMNAYWKLVAIPPSNSYNFNLKLHYEDPWTGTNPVEANMVMAQKNTPTVPWRIYSTQTTLDTLLNNMSILSIDSLGIFTGTDYNNPLPLKLLDISATKVNKDVRLNWATASEKNVRSFEVEKSVVNSQWMKLDAVKAAGNSNSMQRYQFIDYSAFNMDVIEQTIYYRLKIIDDDGNYEYSGTVSVNQSDELRDEIITVYPNPVEDDVYIKISNSAEGYLDFSFTDIAGKMVMNKTQYLNKGINLIKLETDDLNKGFYILRMERKGKLPSESLGKTSKIVKK